MSDERALGRAALQARDFEAAVAHLSAAREAAPDDPMLLTYLGAALGQAGRAAEAVAVLQRAVDMEPERALPRYNLGVALERAGRTPEAAAAYAEAAQLDPAHTRAREAAARLGAALHGPDATAGTPPLPAAAAPAPEAGPAAPGAFPFPVAQPATVEAAAGLHAPAATGPALAISAAAAGGPPGAGRRIARGIGWGAVYGQIWTVLFVMWELIWGGWSTAAKEPGMFIVFAVLLVLFFAFAGSVTGLVAGAANASEGTAAAIGIGVGLLLCLAEVLISGPEALINVIFWFFTGRWVGAGIGSRVQRPVAP